MAMAMALMVAQFYTQYLFEDDGREQGIKERYGNRVLQLTVSTTRRQFMNTALLVAPLTETKFHSPAAILTLVPCNGGRDHGLH